MHHFHLWYEGPIAYCFNCLTNLPLDKMVAISQIFRSIFMNKKFDIFIKISLKFVPKGPIDNNPALV